MFLPHHETVRRLAEERVRNCLREAERHRLLHEAGVDERGWLSSRFCRLLSRLGRLLVALGQWLEHYEVPSAEADVASQVADVAC